jgi:hypothetical protein
MTTAKQARTVIRSRLEAGGLSVPLRWQNEEADSSGNVELPDLPAPFVYTEFLTDPAQLVSFGGGRYQNRYRNPARLDAYVFVPKGEGLDEAETIAEQIAVLFRSYRDTDISCFDATVYPGGDGASLKPPGLNSEVGNYYWACCEVSLFFDQTG